MTFVGVDLAWGERGRTGLAVLDDEGRLVHVSSVRTDAEILDALEPFVDGACIVAFDAPLVVKNPTGNRPAEAALNRDFARFHAGAHPANTSKPEFRDGPRAARLAKALGLDLDPRSRRRRRALEVYPHPATVSLFRLGRTLKYKNRTDRDLPSMRAALCELVAHLESLGSADPPLLLGGADGTGGADGADDAGAAWAVLAGEVAAAPSKSALRLAEDRVDAVVCAYVALLAGRRPDVLVTYGDLETGYIVTPALPDGLLPAAPGTAAADAAVDGDAAVDAEVPADDAAPGGGADRDAVADAVRAYADRFGALTRAGEVYVDLVRSVLDEAGINYLTVSGRTKSVASFAQKAGRTVDGRPLYADPLREITDQLGVRVVTYVLGDVAAVAELLADQVVVLDDRDLGRETASQGRFGYASRHLVVTLDDERARHPAFAALRGLVAAVQIRTVLQHAWAEFEHDIRYKGTVPQEHAPEFDRRFTLAAGLLELADREFSTIRDRLQSRLPDAGGDADGGADGDPRIAPRELAAFLAGQYADAGWSRTDHYAWISGLLLELGVTSLTELAEVLRPVNRLDLNARMDYRYPPGAVRRLDDALLLAFGEQYVGLHGNAHRVDLLADRLERLRRTPDA